jgi:hypothetical protein
MMGNILPKHLAFANINLEYIVVPGDFGIMVSISSMDKDLMKTILHVI